MSHLAELGMYCYFSSINISLLKELRIFAFPYSEGTLVIKHKSFASLWYLLWRKE